MKTESPLKRTAFQKLWDVVKILFIFLMVSNLAAFFFLGSDVETFSGNVAVIPIHGIIATTGGGGVFSDDSVITSEEIIESLEKAEESGNIRAILLDINSPGGSGVAADEVGQKIKSMNKTTIAVIRDVGASAAYWIASSTDYIYANRLSLTGSIGVIGSYLDFSGLIQEYNVTYRRYVSGELKDMGSPFKEPGAKEKEVYQQIIDRMKDFFIDEVAENRGMARADVEKAATGQIFLGVDAKKIGLIDGLGTKEDALLYIEAELNITAEPVEYKKKAGLMELLSELRLALTPKIGNFINPAPSYNVQLR